MKELANLARRSGLHRLGLSVQKGNRAQHLYRRLGYEQVAEGDNDIVMVLDLTGA
jgi:ribosomal protein S18 acetylase RimI-like enzyme